MRAADRVAAVALIVLAAWFVAIGRRFAYWRPETGPGSGFLPVWLGIALAAALVTLATLGVGQGDARNRGPRPRSPPGRRRSFTLLRPPVTNVPVRAVM